MARNGCLMRFEPLAAWRHVAVTDQHTMLDFADCLCDLVAIHRPAAPWLRIVLDNRSTDSLAALYKAVAPAEARRLAQRLASHAQARPLAPHGRH